MTESTVDGAGKKGLLSFESGLFGRRSNTKFERQTGGGDADTAGIVGITPSTSSSQFPDGDAAMQGMDARARQVDGIMTRAVAATTSMPTDPALAIDKIDAKVPFPSNLPSQYRALISQIESSKHPNYPFILRRVYESGHLKNFLQYLDKRVEARDSEIERVCASHTSSLTEAAKDLMTVSEGITGLQASLGEDRQNGGHLVKEMSVAAKAAAKCNTALANTALLMERISILKPVIKTVGEAQVCIDNGQLVKALRKLHDAWEKTRKLPHHIRLVKSLADNIPFMRAQLITEAKRGITTSLESARTMNLKAGYLTLKNVCEANGIYVEPYYAKSGRSLSTKYAEELAFLKDRSWSLENAINIQPLLVFRHVMVNFESDDLDPEALKNYCESYVVQRRSQVSQMAIPPNHMHGVDHFRHYIQDIIGIFSLELYISNMIPGIASDTFFSELWNETSPGVANALSSNCVFITDEESCAQVKNLMNLFAVALTFLHCDSTRIYGVLQDIRDHYGEILLRKLVEQMNISLDKDDFKAITVQSHADMDKVLGTFPYRADGEDGGKTFPRTLPFSPSVPQFYALIKEYIATYVQFSRDLNLSQTEVDEKVRKSTNTVLSRNLRGCICGLIERGRLTPEQLVQLYSNCTYLEYSCQFLEAYIAEVLQSSALSVLSLKLEHDSLFKDIRSQVEQQIYTTLMNSIEAMVGESRFDSAAAEATSEPSPLCQRVIRYLEVVFGSIRKMPYSVCQTAWMTACKHIANQLQETFVHKSPLITIGGVQQLKNDLGFYEDFLLRQRDHTDPTTLLMAFSDIREPVSMTEVFYRQLTDLLLLWDWTTYFHEHGKKDAKYNRIQPQTAYSILEKMRESDKKKGTLFEKFLQKSERDKKKLLDAIILQLKEMINESCPR